MRDPVADLQRFLDTRLAGLPRLDVLEAGCGSSTHLRFRQPVRLTGIDISRRQLERHAGLDERIEADLEAVDLPPDAFDLVTCWNVLEHLPHPERALERMARPLRPGGLLVLGLPNAHSVKGVATRLLPFPAHVFVYRHLHGNRTAGREDLGPFPTYFRPAVAPPALRRFAAAAGLEVVYADSYDVADLDYFRRSRIAGALYAGARRLAAIATGGRAGDSEIILVLARP